MYGNLFDNGSDAKDNNANGSDSYDENDDDDDDGNKKPAARHVQL